MVVPDHPLVEHKKWSLRFRSDNKLESRCLTYCNYHQGLLEEIVNAEVNESVRRDVSVVIPAYSSERWDLTCQAISSVLTQTVLPGELLVCIDHNRALFERFQEHVGQLNASVPMVRVIESKYEGHQAASRTTAVECAKGDILVFLDDDASGDPSWLEIMLRGLNQTDVIAVGGAPLPVYSVARPSWFPFEFDWIFGCAYSGLPKTAEPVLHLIGTTIAARREDLLAIDGFQFDVFEDLVMCHRLLQLSPNSTLLYEPAAIVRHYVHENRLKWSYFWRRIFWVNRVKVSVMRSLGDGANLTAERRFVGQALFGGTARGVREFLSGDPSGLLRAGATVIGVGLAGTGYVVGLVQQRLAPAA
jgi:glucosyl-dolichyl phosphate glucuronosyltransferase